MITLFALPKPFRGHIGLIQRNAIASWTRMHPTPEIILFGDEDGTSTIAKEFGTRHIPTLERNEYGTPLMSGMFEQAQSLAASDLLCYINADIIVLCDLEKAIQKVAAWRKDFLMVGGRWNVDLDEPDAYVTADSEARLRELVRQQNWPIPIGGMDYFAFPRGLLRAFPPFAVGRGLWDNWLVWKMLSRGVPVVDASPVLFMVHQHHGMTPARYEEILTSEEGRRNYELAGGHFRTRADVTHTMKPTGIRSALPQRLLYLLLRKTRALRHAIGIRRRKVVLPPVKAREYYE